MTKKADMINIAPMTRELLHVFYKRYVPDPDILEDRELCEPYIYDANEVDREFDSNSAKPGRMEFAVLLDGEVIGSVGLKDIDYEKKTCELMIHMTNDSVKNKGYGTQAEKLMIHYAFEILGMNSVLADSLHKNTRSQHVLEKIGFQHMRDDETFRYYRMYKTC